MSELSRELLPCPWPHCEEKLQTDDWANSVRCPIHTQWLLRHSWNRRTALSDSVRVPRDLLDRCIEKSSSNAPNYEAIQALRKWLAASEREAG
jgi:hypothetical protein